MMNKIRQWWIGGAAALALVGVIGVGAAMAQTPSTTKTTPTASVPGTSTQSTDPATAPGTSKSNDDPAHEANETAQQEADEDAGRGPRGGPGGVGDPAKLATFLGTTPDQLRTEMSATGATLATVAQSHGKSRDELKAFLTTDVKTHVADEVTSGELTQSQADNKIADATANLDQMIDHSGGPGRGPGGPGGPGGRGGNRGHGGDGAGYYRAPQTTNTTQTPSTNNG
jgi:hypothetical protein